MAYERVEGVWGTGRFLHGVKKGARGERIRVRTDTGEPEASDVHGV